MEWGRGAEGAAGLEAQISVVEQLSPFFFFLALFAAFVFFFFFSPNLLLMAFSSVVHAHHVGALTFIVSAHLFFNCATKVLA